jgi:hypothetical protein
MNKSAVQGAPYISDGISSPWVGCSIDVKVEAYGYLPWVPRHVGLHDPLATRAFTPMLTSFTLSFCLVLTVLWLRCLLSTASPSSA